MMVIFYNEAKKGEIYCNQVIDCKVTAMALNEEKNILVIGNEMMQISNLQVKR